jgi:hypothetical protein
MCPCDACQVASTGNVGLDIAFSDHHMDVETLKEFGDVVRAIHSVCEDGELCFWSFIAYVLEHHPDVLEIELAPEAKDACDEVLARANPPPVTVRESPQAKLKWRVIEESDDG